MKAFEDESQLVSAARSGSIEAFETLVLRYEPQIRRLLTSLSGENPHLTRQFCQQTFLQAYRKLPYLQGDLATWLYQIALAQVRGSRRIRWIPFTPPHNTEEEFKPAKLPMSMPAGLAEQMGQRDVIQRVLIRMPLALKAYLLLDAEGFSCHQIAEIMEVSLTIVRSCLSHAHQVFHQLSLDELNARQTPPQKTRQPAARSRIPFLAARGQNANHQATTAPAYQ